MYRPSPTDMMTLMADSGSYKDVDECRRKPTEAVTGSKGEEDEVDEES